MLIVKLNPDAAKKKKKKKKKAKRYKKVLDDEIILSNRLYVPEHLVTKKMRKAWTYELLDQPDCDSCKETDCDADDCPMAESEQIEMWRNYRSGEYLGFLRGDVDKVEEFFDIDTEVTDERSWVPMKHKLQFTGKLWSNQKKTVKEWLNYRYGIIKSPPRSGKTVMVVYLACRLKQRMLIMAHQKELLDQFYETFMAFTNAKQLARRHKKPVVGIARSLRDLEAGWDVTLLTYQKFLHKTSKLQEFRDSFGCVCIDEAHISAATRFSQIANELNPYYRFGCTATPKRKDRLHIIMENTLGPVTVKGKSKQMVCQVKYVFTGCVVKPFVRWTTFINRLCTNKKRNKVIIDAVARDLDKDRYVLVTTLRVAHAQYLYAELAKRKYKVDLLIGASKDRSGLLQRARSGKTQVVVANRRITQVGLDVPLWDSIHITLPNMNPYNLEQESSRVRTYYEGKPQPLVYAYIDKGHKVTYAIKSTFDRVFTKLKFRL